MKIWSSTISFARRFWFATDLIDKTLFLGLMVLVGRVATDPDFGWQLRGGLDLIKSFHIPSFDPYSHTLTNYSWVNHEWLSEGILAFIYQYLGMAMVVLLFALLTIGAFWLALSTFKINRKSKLITLAWSLWPIWGDGGFACKSSLGLAWRSSFGLLPNIALDDSNISGGIFQSFVCGQIYTVASRLALVSLVCWSPLRQSAGCGVPMSSIPPLNRIQFRC